jgi:copper(I)-binding protein
VSRSPRRTGVAAISVVVGALALAGCGAGQITQTSTQVAGVNGGSATVGSIAIRDAEFEYEETKTASVYTRGADAPLKMSISNTAATDDKLVSATSPVARSVKITGEAVVTAGQTLVVEGGPAAAAAPTGSATATPSASATESATATATPTATAAPSSVEAAPDEEAEGAQVVLVGVNQEIRPGLSYPVTLTFEKAGPVTLQVPVANPTAPREESAPE